jgi:hypothetical protein
MRQSGISWVGVGVRLVFATALVLLTFNPSGHSFYHWLTDPPVGISAVKAFFGVLLLICWLVCLKTAHVALGTVGAVLGAALFGTAVWLLVDAHWLDLSGTQAKTWAVLIILGLVLGMGLSWSLIRARATGQVEVQ